MSRLRPESPGLRARREDEAALFERGLAARAAPGIRAPGAAAPSTSASPLPVLDVAPDRVDLRDLSLSPVLRPAARAMAVGRAGREASRELPRRRHDPRPGPGGVRAPATASPCASSTGASGWPPAVRGSGDPCGSARKRSTSSPGLVAGGGVRGVVLPRRDEGLARARCLCRDALARAGSPGSRLGGGCGRAAARRLLPHRPQRHRRSPGGDPRGRCRLRLRPGPRERAPPAHIRAATDRSAQAAIGGRRAFALVGFERRGSIVQKSWGRAGADTASRCSVTRTGAPTAWMPGSPAGPRRSTLGRGPGPSAHARARQRRPAPAPAARRDERRRRGRSSVPSPTGRWPRGVRGRQARPLYAHGALDSEEAVVRRTQVPGLVLLRNGIWPLFLASRSGVGETLRAQIEDHGRQVLEWLGLRAGRTMLEWFSEGPAEIRDRSIEWPAANGVPRVLSEMKENGAASSEPGGGLAPAAEALERLRQSVGDLAPHLAGHSAGSILRGCFCSPLADRALGIASLHLLAPACTDGVRRPDFRFGPRPGPARPRSSEGRDPGAERPERAAQPCRALRQVALVTREPCARAASSGATPRPRGRLGPERRTRTGAGRSRRSRPAAWLELWADGPPPRGAPRAAGHYRAQLFPGRARCLRQQCRGSERDPA